MADVLAAMRALAAQVQAETGASRVYVGNQNAVTIPCWVVKAPSVEYAQTFGGLSTLTFAVRYLVENKNIDAATAEVVGVMASPVMVAAVEADDTLGGSVDSALALRARDFGGYTYGETTYLGCEFDVEAYAS